MRITNPTGSKEPIPLTEEDRESILDWLEDGLYFTDWVRKHANGRFTCRTAKKRIAEDPEFEAACRAAREAGAPRFIERAHAIIDADPERYTDAEGNSRIDPASVQRQKNRAYFAAEAAKKFFPKQFGDKVTQDINIVGYDAAVQALLDGAKK